MKYLLIITLGLVIFWLWRHNRQAEKKSAEQSRRPPPAAGKTLTPVVECALCHVHLPQSEALIGREGFYCSEAHRREAGL